MSIQKRLYQEILSPRQNHENQLINYRVRTLHRNQSLKQFSEIKNDLIRKITDKKHSGLSMQQTSFFQKQNLNGNRLLHAQNVQKQHNEDIKIQKKTQKRNIGHRVLRKINSQEIILSNNNPKLLLPDPSSGPKQQNKVFEGLKKKRIQKKTSFLKGRQLNTNHQIMSNIPSIVQIRSQNMIQDKKKSKPKLKLLVRDPFKQSNQIQKQKPDEFQQSKIDYLIQESVLSQSNRRQLEEILGCMN